MVNTIADSERLQAIQVAVELLQSSGTALTAKTPVAISKELAGTPVPLALAATATWVTFFEVQAAKVDAVNSANIFIGLIADLESGTKNYYTLTPGSVYSYRCRPGTKVNLALFGIDGEGADENGVQGLAEPA